jgi:hypothetical protein
LVRRGNNGISFEPTRKKPAFGLVFFSSKGAISTFEKRQFSASLHRAPLTVFPDVESLKKVFVTSFETKYPKFKTNFDDGKSIALTILEGVSKEGMLNWKIPQSQ